MNHKPYIREVENAKGVVLFIHGILSTPRHFDFLVPAVPDDFSVYNILLDGHGGSVQDFSRTSMTKWKQQVKDLLDDLCERYDSVILVGYSMGTLLSIDALPRYNNIRGLLLLNSPLRIFVKPVMNFRSLRICLGIENKNNPHEVMCKNDTSITLTKKMWEYIAWIPHGLELIELSHQCRKGVDNINVPCKAFFGKLDELVSVKSTKELRGRVNIDVTVFDDAGHFYINENDKQTVTNSLLELINNARR